MPMSGWKYGRCGPSCFHPDCDCKPEWFEEKPIEAPPEDRCEYCGRSEGHNEVCVMNEVMQLRAQVRRSDAAWVLLSRWENIAKNGGEKWLREHPLVAETSELLNAEASQASFGEG